MLGRALTYHQPPIQELLQYKATGEIGTMLAKVAYFILLVA